MASFEEQLSELERVVDRLEVGGLPLEESVQLFEAGMRLSNACKAQLSSAESRIRVLLLPEKDESARTEELAVGMGEDAEDGEDFEPEDEGHD